MIHIIFIDPLLKRIKYKNIYLQRLEKNISDKRLNKDFKFYNKRRFFNLLDQQNYYKKMRYKKNNLFRSVTEIYFLLYQSFGW